MRFAATDEDGTTIEAPTPEQLVELVRRLEGHDERFLIVEDLGRPSFFVQALWQPDGWLVERQEGNARMHHQARAADAATVLEVISAWAAGEPVGAEGLAWARLDLG